MTTPQDLCKNVGISQFQPNTIKVFEAENQLEKISIFFSLGQNQIKTLKEASKFLLARDYPSIAFFKAGQTIGAIFVPETYISEAPRILDPRHHFDTVTGLKKDFIGEVRKSKGDFVEKLVYQSLKSFYEGKSENVLILKGIHLPTPNGLIEYDYLIINESRQFFLNIEVKKYLGPIKGKPENDPRVKVANQLKKRKRILQENIGMDFQGQHWRYIQAAVFQSDNSVLEHVDAGCQCDNYVVNVNEIGKMMQN